jgi:hypothetical protein
VSCPVTKPVVLALQNSQNFATPYFFVYENFKSNLVHSLAGLIRILTLSERPVIHWFKIFQSYWSS